jgi:hypothetical protein
MNAPFKRAGLGLVCSVALLLAACGGGSSSSSTTTTASGPTINLNLSQPNLTASLELGQTGNYFVYFPDATSEAIATDSNVDHLQTVSLNSSNGLLSVAPVTGTLPGIYSLIINAANANATSTVTFNTLVYPTGNLSGHPTFIGFVADSSQPDAGKVHGHITISGRNALSVGSTTGSVGSLYTQVLVPAGTPGVTVDSTTSNLQATTNNPDAVQIQAQMTITKATLVPVTVDGVSTGVEVTLTATPPSNGLSGLPYVETIYVTGLSTL